LIINLKFSARSDIGNFFDQLGKEKSKIPVDLLLGINENGPPLVDALMRIVHHNRNLLKNPDIQEGIDLCIWYLCLVFKNMLNFIEERMLLTEGLISYLLDAMKYGSKEARMLFPSLLQMHEVTTSQLFIDKVG